VGGRRLKDLLSEFFGGSPQRLMAHLIKEGKVDEVELAEIREMLRSAERKAGGGS
jgi:hypothetical protein